MSSSKRSNGSRTLGSLLADGIEVGPEFANVAISDLTADSRAVTAGSLFAALPGSKHDGARFIQAAVEAGAAAVLTGRDVNVADCAVPVVRTEDARAALAIAASRFYAPQPDVVAAVTGTNGKTSVSVFLRQIWETTGHRAASLGTIGLIGPGGAVTGSLTTPDPVSLHRTLARLAEDGVDRVAIEASSHGLEQRRLDGVRLAAAAFTNLTRDHLDYHGSLDAYRAAKLRLFDTLLPAGAGAVVDADQPDAEAIAAIARKRGHSYLSVGKRGEVLKLLSVTRQQGGSQLLIEAEGERHAVELPLVGHFQVSNALVAAGLAIVTGLDAKSALAALAGVKGASGRLELVGAHPSGGQVFVDYAHTPDALANALQALRPHAEGRLVVVFGAGGDRDSGKRPLMGAAAAATADLLFVTDDNPRSEDPAAIRRAVLEGAPRARDVGDRGVAIREAIGGLGAGDVLLIAGKGHETGQEIGGQVFPFSDQDEARKALAAIGGHA